MDKRSINREKKRLYSLLDRAEVPEQKKAVLDGVIDNLAWQRLKLDEAREKMLESSLVAEYHNGKDQYGERENPLFKAYINLWRGYLNGIEKLQAYLPKDLQEEATGGTDIIQELLRMKKATA